MTTGERSNRAKVIDPGLTDPRGETHKATWAADGVQLDCECGASFMANANSQLGRTPAERHSMHVTFRMGLQP